MKSTLLLILLFSILSSSLVAQDKNDCQPSATAPLKGNAVNALISTGGDLWFDGSDAAYTVSTPPDSAGQTHSFASFFAGGLWLGGADPGGGLKVAAQQYGRSRGTFDYGPGPLTETGIQVENCNDWDRLFPITRLEVEMVTDRFNGQPLDTADIPASVLGWPAVGNPYFEAVYGFALPDRSVAPSLNGDTLLPLAPFFDQDQDGLYDPTRGDYPAFCGDQAIWVVFNDAIVHRESNTPNVVQAEVRLLAYSFNSTDDVLNTTTFYHYEVTNRAQEDLLDFHMGLWLDSDLGCFTNDLMGTLPDQNLLYFYNKEATEDSLCITGIATTLNSAPATIVQLLNASDNPATERDENSLYAATNYYGEGLFEGPAAMTDPNSAIEYYHKLTGLWLDGTPVTRNGSGYNGTGETTRFHFDGGTATDGSAWKACTTSGGRFLTRQVTSVGPYHMRPSLTRSFTFGVTTIFGLPYENDCPNLDPIITAATQIKAVYDDSCIPSVLSGNDDVFTAAAAGLRVYPNPASDEINFVLDTGSSLRSVRLFTVDGRRVLDRTLSGASDRISLGNAGLPAGIYVYRVATGVGLVTGRVVIR